MASEDNSFKKDEAFSIFNSNEVRDVVKGFVNSWLKGDVQIIFPTGPELLIRAKFEKKPLSAAEASDMEVNSKIEFQKLILECCGSKAQESKNLEIATNELFRQILAYRLGDRIKGKFIPYSLEERILKLEEGLDKTNNLVKEIVDWFWREKINQ